MIFINFVSCIHRGLFNCSIIKREEAKKKKKGKEMTNFELITNFKKLNFILSSKYHLSIYYYY